MTPDEGHREPGDYAKAKIRKALAPIASATRINPADIDVRNVRTTRWIAAVQADDDPDDPVEPQPLPTESDGGADGFDPLFPPGV